MASCNMSSRMLASATEFLVLLKHNYFRKIISVQRVPPSHGVRVEYSIIQSSTVCPARYSTADTVHVQYSSVRLRATSLADEKMKFI